MAFDCGNGLLFLASCHPSSSSATTNMFGRVRASPVRSLEPLESERSSCKFIKHDSLSIYESTLLKLKHGSRCNPSCNPEDSERRDSSCIMAIDLPDEAVTGCSSSSRESLPESSSSDQSLASSNEDYKMNMSILHFFSKHKSETHARNSSDSESMAIESESSSSSSVSSYRAVDGQQSAEGKTRKGKY